MGTSVAVLEGGYHLGPTSNFGLRCGFLLRRAADVLSFGIRFGSLMGKVLREVKQFGYVAFSLAFVQIFHVY